MKKVLALCMALAMLASCTQKKENTYKYTAIDKDATHETVHLYNRLFQLMDKGIMVAHQDALAYGHDWYKEQDRSDVKDTAGDYPAVVGWELGHIELGNEYNLDSVYFSDMKRYIKETYKRGGITTASWHGDNIMTGNTAWDCAQDSVVRSILPNGSNHSKFLTWLDRVGDFFLDLKDGQGKYIPVVFRMYHEHTGGWFWWGNKQCTPDEYKQLWRMTVDYLRNEKNVHNLLYAYSPSETKDMEEFLERYPGDEYVDILGFDCYASLQNDSTLAKYQEAMHRNLKTVTDYAQSSGKLPIVGETGLQTIPNAGYFDEILYPVISQYKISWVLFWRNSWEPYMRNAYFVPYEGHQAAPAFKEFTSRPDILMNEDINKSKF